MLFEITQANDAQDETYRGEHDGKVNQQTCRDPQASVWLNRENRGGEHQGQPRQQYDGQSDDATCVRGWTPSDLQALDDAKDDHEKHRRDKDRHDNRLG
jgi:hypothetical protein